MKRIPSGYIILLVTIGLVFTFGPHVAYAANGFLVEPSSEANFKSKSPESPYSHDSVVLSVNDMEISIIFKSEIKADRYRIVFRKIGSALTYYNANTIEPSSGGFSTTVDTKTLNNGDGLPKGQYYLRIARINGGSVDYGSYSEALLSASSTNISLLTYPNVENSNTSISTNPVLAPSAYLEANLSDIPYFLKDSDMSEAQTSLSSPQVKYIKDLTNRIVDNAPNDSAKLKAIYKYVAGNFYYDRYAFEKGGVSIRYANPYNNLKKLQGNINSANSTARGQTGVVCTGYTTAMLSMLRSQGIPARMVYGYHLSPPTDTWASPTITNEEMLTYPDHYWSEAYIDGRWVVCDANMGSRNRWERTTSASMGTWTKTDVNNYTFLDPSPEQFAINFYTQGVYSRTFISAVDDASKVRNFLAQKTSKGKTNAEIVSFKDQYDIKGKGILSWDTGQIYANTRSGKVEKINWAYKGLAGKADFSNLKSLRNISFTKNPELTHLNLSGNSSMTKVWASSSGLKEVDVRKCGSLELINLSHNPLESAKYTYATKYIANISAGTGGTFHVKYENGKHTLVAKPNKGYNFRGWYNANGTKISSSATLTRTSKITYTRIAKFGKLAAPTGLKVTTGAVANGQKITWKKVTDAHGYYLYRSTSKNGKYVLTATTNGYSKTTVNKTGLLAGTTQYYYVVAYRNSDIKGYAKMKSAVSVKVSAKVVPPRVSHRLSAGSKSVTIRWNKIGVVSGYQVYQSTSSKGTYRRVRTASADITSYKKTKLKKGKRYYYKVRAYKVAGGKKVYGAFSTVKSTRAQ